jgi:DNA polymerase elongation subunit (family B)
MREVNDKHLKRVIQIYKERGYELTCKILNLKSSSLERYLRLARVRELMEPEQPDEDPQPNVLLLDIENSPSLAAVWGVNKQVIHTSQIVQEWYMFSWAARWLHSTEMFSDVITPEESVNQDDERIVRSLWEFVDYADIIVGHNVVMFDAPKANARFLKYGIDPPSSYQLVDTLRAARRHFLFTSNKLDYLCQQLGIPRKISHEGMELWLKCMRGDSDALQRMLEYNEHDVVITEDLYIKLLPYMKSHPNMGLFYKSEVDLCYKCGSSDLDWLDTFYYTNVNKFSEYRCNKCGSIGRSRFSAYGKDERKHLTSPVAR